MKKLFIILIVLAISIPSIAQLKEKQVIGNWKYIVQTDEGQITGVVAFVSNQGKLEGKVTTSEGDSFPMLKIELKEENTLYFEVQPDMDLIKVSVVIDGDNFKGKGSTSEGSFDLTGKKLVNP